ncbi:hypothetical protein Igag_0423 [Ignisphaera aggregans DSM 17230]|uniref:DUF4129 domain-containing protein n=1 Tax=Ignisphaera aggregans (strain DSM 17230 / JCM 13409 / AQ1.S1) TaxID=583356 RepID=E0SRI6_IGNAA|nr:hypothetical protein Igag_0423 [Ignisphaera aggregans DSM 17230]
MNISLKGANLSFINLSISPGVERVVVATESYTYSDIFLYIILIISLAFIIIMIFLYLWGSQKFSSSPIYIGRKKSSDTIPIISYVYEGVKRVLREHYIVIRDRMRCRHCTPREIAIKIKSKPLELFAHVYEDVVYGSKSRKDIYNVIDMVKNFLEKNE